MYSVLYCQLHHGRACSADRLCRGHPAVTGHNRKDIRKETTVNVKYTLHNRIQHMVAITEKLGVDPFYIPYTVVLKMAHVWLSFYTV